MIGVQEDATYRLRPAVQAGGQLINKTGTLDQQDTLIMS